MCAKTAKEYIRSIEQIRSKIGAAKPNARIVFINAWLAYDNDPFAQQSEKERDSMIEQYNAALEKYCTEHDFIYIGANEQIASFLDLRITDNYILDYIHPNANQGIILYCNAVLYGAPKNWAIRSEESK
jgi:lysophospholipase L1-like esterase